MSIIINKAIDLSKITLAVLTISMATGCTKKVVERNEDFDLRYKKALVLEMDDENYKIEFSDLITDSRCPEETHCLTEGEVAVLLTIDDEFQLVLGNGNYPSKGVYKTHIITLIEADFGRDKNQGEAKHYTLTLKLS